MLQATSWSQIRAQNLLFHQITNVMTANVDYVTDGRRIRFIDQISRFTRLKLAEEGKVG